MLHNSNFSVLNYFVFGTNFCCFKWYKNYFSKHNNCLKLEFLLALIVIYYHINYLKQTNLASEPMQQSLPTTVHLILSD